MSRQQHDAQDSPGAPGRISDLNPSTVRANQVGASIDALRQNVSPNTGDTEDALSFLSDRQPSLVLNDRSEAKTAGNPYVGPDSNWPAHDHRLPGDKYEHNDKDEDRDKDKYKDTADRPAADAKGSGANDDASTVDATSAAGVLSSAQISTASGGDSLSAAQTSALKASGLQNILSIPGDTSPKLTNNTFGSGSLSSASLNVSRGAVTMTESGANADEMWYSHYKDNGGNIINDQIQVTLPDNLKGVHAVEMGVVLARNGYKDEFELQFKSNGNGTDTMRIFSNNPALGAHGGWVDPEVVPALHGGTNTIDFTGQILNQDKDLKFTRISVNGKNVALPPEIAAGSDSGWGLKGQVDQHMQIDNNSGSAPITSSWVVESSQDP